VIVGCFLPQFCACCIVKKVHHYLPFVFLWCVFQDIEVGAVSRVFLCTCNYHILLISFWDTSLTFMVYACVTLEMGGKCSVTERGRICSWRSVLVCFRAHEGGWVLGGICSGVGFPVPNDVCLGAVRCWVLPRSLLSLLTFKDGNWVLLAEPWGSLTAEMLARTGDKMSGSLVVRPWQFSSSKCSGSVWLRSQRMASILQKGCRFRDYCSFPLGQEEIECMWSTELMRGCLYKLLVCSAYCYAHPHHTHHLSWLLLFPLW